MTAEGFRLTDSDIDQVAAELVPVLEKVADVAWVAMGRPRGAQHIPLPPRTEKGLGRLTCPDCGQPTVDHSLSGGHPTPGGTT